jgi:ABC-type transport system substrate-binding protein
MVEAVTEYVGFNMQDPIVGKNKPLRQAMSLAYDRETFIRNFLNGRGTPCIGPIPPGFPTFDANRMNPYTQLNLALARQKMREAERINGGPIPPLSLLMRDADTNSRQMADYFVGQMRQIGITVVPEFRDFARWIERVDNRQTQIFDAGWEADYPDEQNFFQLFYGKNAPAGGVNSTAYVNPAFDALYVKAAAMNDSPARRALYRQMEDIVMEDCCWLLQEYPVLYSLRYDWMGNMIPMNYGHGTIAHYELDSALRAKRLKKF